MCEYDIAPGDLFSLDSGSMYADIRVKFIEDGIVYFQHSGSSLEMAANWNEEKAEPIEEFKEYICAFDKKESGKSEGMVQPVQ